MLALTQPQNVTILVCRYPICPRKGYSHQKHGHISCCVLGSVLQCQRVSGILHRGQHCWEQRVGALQQQARECHQVKMTPLAFFQRFLIQIHGCCTFCIYRFICHGLITGEKYVFRVRAVNAAGISQFSQESEAVEVKAAIGEYSGSITSKYNKVM